MRVHERDLVTRQEEPFNAETPIGLNMPEVTPTSQFYVRNHFPIPAGQPAGLRFDGAVRTPSWFSLDMLRDLRCQTVTTTMECAGNGRAFLTPQTGGVAWQLGAVGTAEWTGVPLRALLDRAELQPEAIELVFHGRDRGVPSRATTPCNYERSLPVQDPIVDQTLVVFAMNGEALTQPHGAPLRLIVPGFYGMASVKWLDRVTALTEQFAGYFQVGDYVMRRGGAETPCREMAVRALISEPSDGADLRVGAKIEIAGFAWSGSSPIDRVEVSTHGGKSWIVARLSATRANVWSRWSAGWSPSTPGCHSLLARATDRAGNIQPVEQVWNEGGYGNNACVPVVVSVSV